MPNTEKCFPGVYASRQAWLLAGLGVAFTFLVLTLRLTTMDCVLKWDAWNQQWPWFHHLALTVAEGRLPLWDPRPNCGFPFFAEPQTGTFYPVFLVSAFLFGGSYLTYLCVALAHWLFGIFGIFFLMKRTGISAAGAFVAAVAFGFNGFFVGNAEHITCIITISYVPWALLALDHAYNQRTSYALLSGVLFGFAGLGGNPGLTGYAGLMILVWCCLRYRQPKKTAVVMALTFLSAAIVLAPSYFSFFFECRAYTDRTTSLTVWEACDFNRFPLEALASLIAPAATLRYTNLFGTFEPTMLNGYLGVWGLFCLITAILDRQLRRQWCWLLVFIGFAFLFSLGTIGGLRWIAYHVLPGFDLMRHTGTARVFWQFGGSFLSGVVLDRMLAQNESGPSLNRSQCVKIASILLLATVCTLAWAYLVPEFALEFHADRMAIYPNSLMTALSVVSGQLLLTAVLLLVVLVYAYSGSMKLVLPLVVALVVADAASHISSNAETVCRNSNAAEDVRALENLSVISRRLPLTGSEKRNTSPAMGNLWAFDRMFYARAYLATTSASYDFLVGNTQFPPFTDTSFLGILRDAPRFWLVPVTTFARGDDREALSTLRNTGSDEPLPVFIHEAPQDRQGGPKDWVKPGTFGSVTIRSYGTTEVSLSVNAPHESWLFSTERYAPAWKAYVDDVPTRVHRANFVFRAIRIPEGTHTVVMQFDPWLYKPLWWVSMAFSLMVGVALSWPHVRSRVSRSRSARVPQP